MNVDRKRAGSIMAVGFIAGASLLVPPLGAAAAGIEQALERIKSRGANSMPVQGDAFSVRPPERPHPPAVRAPVKPVTPAFPLRVLGRLALGSEPPLLVLGKGEQFHSLRAGDSIEGFRIDRIGEDGFTATYLATAESRSYSYAQMYAASASAAPASAVQPVSELAQAGTGRPPHPQRLPIGQPAEAERQGASPSAPAAVPPGQGGMVMVPPPPDSPGMVMTPAPAGGGMVMTPPPPGGGMVMTPPPAGAMRPEGSARQQ